MRILILLNSRFPTQKAYGLQVLAMARGFVQAGDEVTVAFPRRAKGELPVVPGVRFEPFGPNLILSYAWQFPLYRLLGLIGVPALLRRLKPDLCIVNDPFQAAFFPPGWAFLWDMHDLPDPGRMSRRWLIGRILRRASGLLSTNQLKLDRLKLLGFHLPPVIVLPNPVTFDPEVYRSITREAARRQCGMGEGMAVVYTGQLYGWKGVDTLIRSAAFLPPAFRLHIVGGSGEDFERAQSLAASLPSGGAGIVFHGQRPAEEVPFWLRAADIVVIPNSGKHRLSIEDTNPLKAIEAMAAEAVIVASDLPALRDALSGYGAARFFPADDAQALAQEVKHLVDGPAALYEMRRTVLGFALLTAKERAVRIRGFVQGMMHPSV